jgi:hypothetical protein
MAALAVSLQATPVCTYGSNGVCPPDPLTVTITGPDTEVLKSIVAQQGLDPNVEANRTLVVEQIVHAYLLDHAARPNN